MSTLTARRCLQHASREAVARCPSCAGDFCRECVVEHTGRLLCATCLAREIAAVAPARISWRRWREALATAGCVFLLWAVLYFTGALVKAIPPELHDGTIWRRQP
jgi:hypothetical protein